MAHDCTHYTLYMLKVHLSLRYLFPYKSFISLFLLNELHPSVFTDAMVLSSSSNRIPLSFKSRDIIINIEDVSDEYEMEILLLSSEDSESKINFKFEDNDEPKIKFDACSMLKTIDHKKNRNNVTLTIGIKPDNVWNFDFILDDSYYSMTFTCRVFDDNDKINSISFSGKYPTWIRYSSRTEGK